jgi:hypothetical protein
MPVVRENVVSCLHDRVAGEPALGVVRLDLALEQLSSLGLINHHSAPGPGRHSTMWDVVVPPLKGCPISPNVLCWEIWETQTLIWDANAFGGRDIFV